MFCRLTVQMFILDEEIYNFPTQKYHLNIFFIPHSTHETSAAAWAVNWSRDWSERVLLYPDLNHTLLSGVN